MDAAARADGIDAALSNAVRDGLVPGVAAAVTDRSGTIYEGAFGSRVLGRPEAMTPDSVVWLASMTKAITAVAAMQLVERGRLHLDEAASVMVPDLGAVQVLEGFDDEGMPRTRPPRRPVTLRHLLTHTAGFADEIWAADITRFRVARDVPPLISGLDAALATPLLFDPGDEWRYGIGIDWAGKMIEAASGQCLGHYLEEHVFGPIGMGSTAFRLTSDMRSRLAAVHQREAADVLAPQLEFEIPQDPEFEMGGGGLYSTARDYLGFVRMILDGGRAAGAQVLAPETVHAMSRNAIGRTRVRAMRSANPGYSLDAEFFPGVDKTWGLSFQINEQPAPTGRPAGGLMWAGLANTYFWIDRTSGIAGVFMTQILPFADPAALRLYYDFERAFYA
ncbi:serine hydrolase domain-containing protein [Agromyces seonyuensis]|uniref:Serine hydrolase n=1 Tax=Agromyces seonyuensis TaxID=2662446 RepID=A0A6I4NUC1_9MICO|nr:serine hydrolase domain-containing protein [Agromyces seonyuensis]MWB97833.1 serine hydrolase [Agromyces seonyuensis]